MNEFCEKALSYFKEHWHVGMTGTADAADMLNINRNTFKTRLARGQALVLRNEDGSRSRTLMFTGYHLVYNLLSDRMLRYGFPVEHDESTMAELPSVYADWAFENILSGRQYTRAVLRLRRTEDGAVLPQVHEDGEVEKWPQDAALFIPLGNMIVELAGLLYLRHDPSATLNRIMSEAAG